MEGATIATPETITDDLIAERDDLVVAWHNEGLSQQAVIRRLKKMPRFIPVSTSQHAIRKVYAAKKLKYHHKKPDKDKIEREKQQIRELAAQGLCAEQIRKKLSLSLSTFRTRLKHSDIEVQWRKFDGRDGLPDNINELITKWYLEDLMRVEDIADKVTSETGVKRTHHWVHVRLRQLGVKRSPAESARLANATGRKKNPKTIDLSKETEDEIVRLYQEGYGAKAIKKQLGFSFSHNVVFRVLKHRKIKTRSRGAESLHASPASNVIQVTWKIKDKIGKTYIRGHGVKTIMREFGLTEAVVVRILNEQGIKRRGYVESVRARVEMGKHKRRRAKLHDVADRLAEESDAIHESICYLYNKYHRGKHNYGLTPAEYIEQAVSMTPEVAARWKPQAGGDNFVWFVARYALLAVQDPYKSQAKRKNAPPVIDSLSYELSDGFELGSTIASDRESAADVTVEWEESKQAMIQRVKTKVDTGKLPALGLAVVLDYLIPMAEQGSPTKLLTEVAVEHGYSESYASQILRHPEMKDAAAVVFLGKQQAA